MAFKFVDKSKEFTNKLSKNVDTMLSAMGVDIIRLSKQKVPVSAGGGHLQSSGIIKKKATNVYQIQYNKKYAAYQHRGMRKDGSRVVNNYTTSGTGAKFLSDPAEEIINKKKSYFNRYLKT